MEDPSAPGSIPPGEPYQAPPPPQAYPPSGSYGQPPYAAPGPAPVLDQGLSDTAAGALAYITIIPAIIFLVLEPYNRRPFVKFHAFQCLGLAVVWFCLGFLCLIPFLGWLVWMLGSVALLVAWVVSIVKASQGSYFKLPYLSDFASKQSGYPIV